MIMKIGNCPKTADFGEIHKLNKNPLTARVCTSVQ